MIIHILFLLLVLFFFLYGIALFVPTIVELLLNLPILYAILLRSYVELFEERKYVPYLIGLLAALLFFLAQRSLFLSFTTHYILWSPTLFLIVAFVVAQLIILFDALNKRYSR
ncbi:hypothetical protein HYV81_02560 [Candidatus Woesearchaeota archaeon]|nr:hypothetical protein [Candidatus Woesearchaeota archaeon]